MHPYSFTLSLSLFSWYLYYLYLRYDLWRDQIIWSDTDVCDGLLNLSVSGRRRWWQGCNLRGTNWESWDSGTSMGWRRSLIAALPAQQDWVVLTQPSSACRKDGCRRRVNVGARHCCLVRWGVTRSKMTVNVLVANKL
jgi:hypothetical protein